MFKSTPTLIAGTLIGLVAGLASEPSRAQFQAPANSLALEEDGTLEAMQGNQLKFRDSNQEVWLITVNGQTKVSIEGVADLSYLRPGMTVEFKGKVEADATLAEPLTEIEVVNSKGRQPIGLFSPDDDPETAKPVRNPAPGEYRVRGRVTRVKDGELDIAAGRLKLLAKAADDLKVKLSVDDPRLAQFGDQMKLKAWYYENQKPIPTFNRAGVALAEEVSITLQNLPDTGKRGR